MAAPQLEDGHLKIANELFEALVLAPLSKREYKVILAVIRKTYGYNKKFDVISMWWIASMTGIKRGHVAATAAELVRRKILIRKDGEVRHGQSVFMVGINKNYTEWTVPKTDPAQNRTGPETGTEPYPKQVRIPYPKRDTYKDNKDNKDNIARSFDQFYSAYPRKAGKKHALKAFARLKPDDALLSLMLSAIEKQKQARAEKERRGIWVPELKHPATWINGGCWEDEVEDVKPKPRRVVV